MKRLSLLALCLFAGATLLMSSKDPGDDKKKKNQGKEPAEETLTAEQRKLLSIIVSLKYDTSSMIKLAGNMGTVKLAKGFKFLDAAQADKVVYDLWGNVRSNDASSKLLGMIFPENGSPIGDSSWAFLVQYEEIGYVKDGDAAKINYDDLKKDIQKDQEEVNKMNVPLGASAMHFVDWAEKPYYDADKKVLYWAKNIKVDGEEINTLNYDIRVLGRKGIMKLQAVSGLNMLAEVNKYKNQMLEMVSFGDGNKYSDYNSSTDKVAAYTIGGLVAGKVLAKVGIFALLLKNIKLVLLAIAAFGAGIWRFITGRRKKEEEMAPYNNTTDGQA